MRKINKYNLLTASIALTLAGFQTASAEEPSWLSKTNSYILNQAELGETQNVIVVFKNEPTIQAFSSQPQGYAGETEEEHTARMVSFKANAYGNMKSSAFSAYDEDQLEIKSDYANLPMANVAIKDAQTLEDILARDDVAAVYPNNVNKMYLSQSLPLINQPAANSMGQRGTGTTVAVLDTGVDFTKSAFGSCQSAGGNCKVVAAIDFARQDNQRDAHGHGTNVAGIVLGTAPGAKIAALDVFDGDGAFDSDILDAIDWAIDNQRTHNIVAMNLSLGGGQFFSQCANTSFTKAFADARAAGILPVVASGNEGFKSSMARPACVPGAVSVGAVFDSNMGSVNFGDCRNNDASADVPTCFSNSDDYLSLLAPGWRITAAGITQGGTSQATPHVAGAIAVLRANGAYPNDSVSKTVQRLQDTGEPVVDPGNGQITPRIDLQAALADVAPDVPNPEPTPDPDPTPNPDPQPKTIWEIILEFLMNLFRNL